MSLRAIAHKLTESGIVPPAMSRGWKVKSAAWRPSTVHKILTATENIGTITICKTKKGMTASGTDTRKPNDQMTSIPGGIPALIPDGLYDLAQYKLKHNRIDKSHAHHKPEDFLLKSHVVCKTCGYRMASVYRFANGIPYGVYRCRKYYSKYDRCPDFPEIKADKVNAYVWEDCCRVFESIEEIRDTIRAKIEEDVKNFLENSSGVQQTAQLRQELAQAEVERDKHTPGSYYYNLVTQDIQQKQAQLRKYAEEASHAEVSAQLLDVYQRSVFSFLDFLSTMRGRYHEATFKEKRNALDVLGVTVTVQSCDTEVSAARQIETDKEWLSLTEAAGLAGLTMDVLPYHIGKGELAMYKREESRRNRYVNRDELNRFLSTFNYTPQAVREDVQARVEIQYSPIFTGVQSSLM
jgi:site-specific DNA recombinase